MMMQKTAVARSIPSLHTMKSVLRHIRRIGERDSVGEVPGIYLKPWRNSKVQFAPVFLSSNCYSQANVALNRELDRLFTVHGEANIDWYAERSLGCDVAGRIAWNNMDITDAIVL